MATIKMTARRLAEISEKSPGYSVDYVSKGPKPEVCTLSNIRFHRRNGRRFRAMVEADIRQDGVLVHEGRFGDDVEFNVVD